MACWKFWNIDIKTRYPGIARYPDVIGKKVLSGLYYPYKLHDIQQAIYIELNSVIGCYGIFVCIFRT